MGLLPGGKFTHEFDWGIYLTVLFLKKKLKKRERGVTRELLKCSQPPSTLWVNLFMCQQPTNLLIRVCEKRMARVMSLAA